MVKMVFNVEFWLSCLLHKDRVHTTLRQRRITKGLYIDQKKHCELEFGNFFKYRRKVTTDLCFEPCAQSTYTYWK